MPEIELLLAECKAQAPTRCHWIVQICNRILMGYLAKRQNQVSMACGGIMPSLGKG